MMTKQILAASICLLLTIPAFSFQKKSKNKRSKTVDIEQLLSEMSLEEKVGQMTQITLDVITKGKTTPYGSDLPMQLDPAAVQKVLIDYKVGSILNTPGMALKKEEWYQLVKELQEATQKTPRQIPIVYGIDAIHGVNYTQGATLFPQQIGLAATFNYDLVKELGAISAYETRASSLPWNFSPVLGLGKNPLWPRLYETFGEDTYLGKELGRAMIEGYQGDNIGAKDKVAACMKHYLGYSVPLSGKDRTPAWIPERELRQYFLPQFQAAVDAGVATVMINSGEINGTPVHANKYLLTTVLRDELGFEGVAVTDWADIDYLYTRHKVASSKKEAVRMAIEAGIDMSMVPHHLEFADHLIELVKEGKISEERIDLSVRRILKFKQKLDLFENPTNNPKNYPKFGSTEFAERSKIAAIESFTLLKNKGNILPLAKDKKILITGPGANSMRPLNGGWSYNWQGSDAEKYAEEHHTIKEAFEATKAQITYIPGTTFDGDTGIQQQALDAAKSSDYILLCLGENSYTETPGNFNRLEMPRNQLDFAKALAETGTKIILVLLEGRPLVFSEIEPLVDAVFQGYIPGNYGADALVDLVFGNANPSGRLPYNYPKHPNAIVSYNHKHTESIKIPNYYDADYDQQYEFGDGLSYTTFSYSDLKVTNDKIRMNESVEISVNVTNTGNRKGKESVLLFLKDLYATISPEVRSLKGFKKIELEPGASQTVSFTLGKDELSFVTNDYKWTVEPGDFEVQIGDQTTRFEVIK